MVMATPSPQQVGREFVRQYYTVLHEAPEVLHRFYSSGSTFVHGGVDRPGMTEEPVVGQLEIDKKIKLLNFKDCHTKIRQVDSQSTIGNGVVVQVTGELSNNGEPMRRFMQTFVLAPQTPKKYYVHNDIFRYQDEVYQDNSDTESEETPQTEPQKPVINYYQNQQEIVEPEQVVSPSQLTSQTEETLVEINKQPELSVTPVPEEENKPEETLNMNGHLNAETPEETIIQTEEVSQTLDVEVKEKVELYSEPEPVKPNVQIKEETKEATSEKNSWAKIISNSSTVPSLSASNNSTLNADLNTVQTFLNTQPAQSRYKDSQTSTGNSSKPSKPNQNGYSSKTGPYKPRTQREPNQQQPQQQPLHQSQQQQQLVQNQAPVTQIRDSEENEKRFGGKYPDEQQVFVGNLSQEISDAELKAFFSQYGKVIEVRINPNTKQQSGRRLPNYGFVVFEDRASVENLLITSKSSLLFVKDKVEYRLNIEEKRARQGRMMSGYGGSGNKSNNRGNRSMSNGSRNGPTMPNGAVNPKKSQQNNNYENNNYGGFGEKRNNENTVSDTSGGNIRKNNPRRS